MVRHRLRNSLVQDGKCGRILDNLCQKEQVEDAVEIMEQRRFNMSRDNAYCLLQECIKRKYVEYGRHVQSLMAQNGLHTVEVLGNHLIRLFGSCGLLSEATEAFHNVLKPTVYTWSSIIGAHANHGQGETALDYYAKMRATGAKCDKHVYLAVLKACSTTIALKQGRQVHYQIVKSGLECDVIVGSALVDMYAKCGSLTDAQEVFDELQKRDVVSCTALILGYVQHGEACLALDCFKKMPKDGIRPDKVTFLAALRACGSIRNIVQGRLVHVQILKYILQSDVVIENTLVDMYAKCGSLNESRRLFESLPTRTVVSWGAMIAGYTEHGEGLLALNCFRKMKEDGMQADDVIFSSVLKACGKIGARDQGRIIHEEILKLGLESDVILGSTLIDMYARCGDLEDSREVFDRLPNQNVVSWGAMIAGYAQHGEGLLAIECFEMMLEKGIKPDNVTFSSLLVACSRAGLIDKGRWYFQHMKKDHGVVPDIDHYTCMIDLLGRAGCLKEAADLLQTTDEPATLAWRSLLNACRKHGDVELARRCFYKIVHLDPHCSPAYILMSNIFADAHMQEEAHKVEKLRLLSGVRKEPGMAWIEIDRKVHQFVSGEKIDPQSIEIDAILQRIDNNIMKKTQNSATCQVSRSDSFDALCGHAQRSAIAFGILNTPFHYVIRVTKNLEICPECHDATKEISAIEGREIMLKCTDRIHHFKDGICSCRDYY